MSQLTYLQAISDALRFEMRRDPGVLLLGEDIGTFGGAFKITQGFLEEFGPDRVIDSGALAATPAYAHRESVEETNDRRAMNVFT